MNLEEYFHNNPNMKKSVFAKKLGISRQHLHQIIKKKTCSIAVALQIEKSTEGQVSTDELIGKVTRKEFGELIKRVEALEEKYK